MENELYHYGILGQKWGVRRFQKADGTRTAAGKERYSSGKWEKLNKPSIKGGKDKPNASPLEVTFNQSGRIIDSTEKGVDAIQRIKDRHTKTENRAAGKSDEELRATINRMNLEKQYNELTKADTNRGFEETKDILSVVGSVVSIGAGAAVIYKTLKGV